VQRNPRDGDRLFGLGQSHYWVGYVHWRRRNLDEALQHFKAYLDVAAQLGALDPGRADWRRELAYANSNIGSVLQERHDLPGALQRFRVCLDIERALLAAAPRDQDLEQSVAASHNAIGAVLKSLGRLTEALEQFRAEAVIRERLVALGGANVNSRLRLSTSHAVLEVWVLALLQLRRPNEALPVLRKLQNMGYRNLAFLEQVRNGGLRLPPADIPQEGRNN
jgi:tetratricopeptide (TPR) repeat protein